ncbi:MAG: hypothetical protein LBH06_06730 [Rikenellaceae bacterium]|jgi:hypothetical protein|nr:hypothetical protein [Rikenellaceae bacterium]
MKLFVVIWKALRVFLLLLLGWMLWGFLVAPVYRFAGPKPFAGENIYDPYSGLDTATQWRKANFHAHSKLNGGLTNGAKLPKDVVWDYRSYDYDIIGISNYNHITQWEPVARTEYHIPVYEHGINLFKYHQLIFGAGSLNSVDIMLPVTRWQKQYLLNRLGRRADLLCVNHPNFTLCFSPNEMRYLTGYRCMEAESGMARSSVYWDNALSSGIPSFDLAGDDSHNTDRPHDIATDCNFLATPSLKYADVLETLRAGRYYAMKIPNFGDGDTTVKRAAIRNLPRVESVALSGDSVSVRFSREAAIRFIGQNGAVKREVRSAQAGYRFTASDTYIRVSVEFDDGVHIFLQPWFRYAGTDPFAVTAPTVNVTLTVLKDIVLAAIMLWMLVVAVKIIVCKKKRYGKGQRYAGYR